MLEPVPGTATPSSRNRTAMWSNDVRIVDAAPDDTFLLHARDPSTDTYMKNEKAAPNIAPAFSDLFKRLGNVIDSGPREFGLTLRSSPRNITGIGNQDIYALPIVSSDLAHLLKGSLLDLEKYNDEDTTALYHFEAVRWSFLVIAPAANLHYATIRAILARYSKLASPSSAPLSASSTSTITWTRAGAIFNSTNDPIASVIFTPIFNKTTTSPRRQPFSSFNLSSPSTDTNSPTSPTEIFHLSPAGTTCTLESLNTTAALAPFAQPPLSQLTKRIPMIPTEVLAQLGHSLFSLSIRLWHVEHDQHPVPVEVKLFAIKALLFLAMLQATLGLLKTMIVYGFDGTWGEARFDSVHPGWDTGFYYLGSVVMRFTIVISAVDPQSGWPYVLERETWLGLIGLLLDPIKGLAAAKGIAEEVFALEGEVRRNAIAVGRWEISFWDAYRDFDA